MIKYLAQAFMAQKDGTCCFVYAVANSVIANGGLVLTEEFEKACDIALCKNGSAIRLQEVVDYLEADLEETEDPDQVFERGGVLLIMHPIFNGHAVYIEPEGDDGYMMVNSFLGPNEMHHINRKRVSQFLGKAGFSHWARVE